VPEHQQLSILRQVIAEHQDGQAEYPAREHIDDLEQHPPSQPSLRQACWQKQVSRAIEYSSGTGTASLSGGAGRELPRARPVGPRNRAGHGHHRHGRKMRQRARRIWHPCRKTRLPGKIRVCGRSLLLPGPRSHVTPDTPPQPHRYPRTAPGRPSQHPRMTGTLGTAVKHELRGQGVLTGTQNPRMPRSRTGRSALKRIDHSLGIEQTYTC
jgi:hypothetical protein